MDHRSVAVTGLRGIVVGAVVAALGAAAAPLQAAGATARSTPDWSGVWSRAEGLEHPKPERILPFMKPDAAAAWKKQIDDHSFRVPWSFCEPAAFPSMMTDIPLQTEYLVTPGRVTVIVADGQVRRIYTDGSKHQEHGGDALYFGDSVGHWEGDTLVVDTTSLRSDNIVVIGLPAGEETMHVTERIRRVDADTLRDDITVDGLTWLARPFTQTQLYKRQAGKNGVEENLCLASKNRNTGTSVDLTPPPGL